MSYHPPFHSHITEQKSSTTLIAIEQWGMIDDWVFYPGAKLALGDAAPGDLLLLQSNDNLQEQRLARQYGGHLILEPHKCRVSSLRWSVVAGVKALVKPLNQAVLGKSDWKIQIHLGEKSLPLAWINSIESQRLDSLYLQELCRQLLDYDSTISVVAFENEDTLEDIKAIPGCISFSLNKRESSSGYVSEWALASKRAMRRRRLQRRNIPSAVELYPIPLLREFERERQVSK